MDKSLVIFSILVLLLGCCSDRPDNIDPPIPSIPDPPISQDTIWSDYLSSSYILIKDSAWSGGGRSYFVSTRKFYFNEDSRNNYFPGMLIDANFGLSKTIKSFNPDILYNKITCIGMDTLVFEMASPSTSSVDSICQIIENNYVKDEFGVIEYNEYEYNSPKELYLKFVYNNLRMDSLVYDKGYDEAQMRRKYGYISSVTQLCYNLSIDFANELVINKELINEYSNSELAYIKSIWYGKIKYLVIESNNSKNEIKKCLSKIRNKEILSEEENLIMSTSLFSLITIDENGNNVINGGIDIVNKYFIDKPNNATELYCIFSNYLDNSVSEIRRRVDFIF